jgi:hypothetical protein
MRLIRQFLPLHYSIFTRSRNNFMIYNADRLTGYTLHAYYAPSFGVTCFRRISSKTDLATAFCIFPSSRAIPACPADDPSAEIPEKRPLACLSSEMASLHFSIRVDRLLEHCRRLYYVHLGPTIHEELPPQGSTIAVSRRLWPAGRSTG